LLGDPEIESRVRQIFESAKGDPDFEREPSNKLALITVTGKMATAISEAAKTILDHEIAPKILPATSEVSRPQEPEPQE
jgi:hypothetical protein